MAPAYSLCTQEAEAEGLRIQGHLWIPQESEFRLGSMRQREGEKKEKQEGREKKKEEGRKEGKKGREREKGKKRGNEMF